MCLSFLFFLLCASDSEQDYKSAFSLAISLFIIVTLYVTLSKLQYLAVAIKKAYKIQAWCQKGSVSFMANSLHHYFFSPCLSHLSVSVSFPLKLLSSLHLAMNILACCHHNPFTTAQRDCTAATISQSAPCSFQQLPLVQ